jgi:hypothetical protein
MKKVFLLLLLLIAVTCVFSQGSQKIKGTSGTVQISDSAAQKKLEADWGKYFKDTISTKATVVEFIEWFNTHLSNKDYQTEFVQKVIPYYNLWVQSKYNEWFVKRPK